MSIYQILDWRWINITAPFVGLVSCAYILFSYKTCTKRIAVSTAVSLAIMFWLMLTWADWGSVVFVASYQTMWARVLLLVISTLVAYELRNYTRTIAYMHSKNHRLVYQNNKLKITIKVLEDQLKK